jgi:hypothetical protein
MVSSLYLYLGHLRHVMGAASRESAPEAQRICIGPDELTAWQYEDDPSEKEWQQPRGKKRRTDTGLLLEGDFEDVKRIDNLDADDPSFWVPLQPPARTELFPVPLGEYPILEVTYRCLTPHTHPAVRVHYDGGVQHYWLPPETNWVTVAMLVEHFGFPERAENVTLRLYATNRRIVQMEVAAVAFRSLSRDERACLKKYARQVTKTGPPALYALLQDFLPIGVTMKADSAKRLAEMMEVSLRDYLRLAFEDIARNHHNAVTLERINALSSGEWLELLSLAESYGLRVVPTYEWPRDADKAHLSRYVQTHIGPYAQSPAILAWCIANEPDDGAFHEHLEARGLIEAVDVNHPLAFILREPGAFPLYAPYFAVGGMSFYRSHQPWLLGEMLRKHRAAFRGQQMWVVGPGFVYATDTPEWHTCAEMRLMLNLTFMHGARGWFAFAYHNEPIWAGGACQRTLTGPFLTFSDLWSELGLRAQRFAAMAPLLLKAQPVDPPNLPLSIRWKAHERAQIPPDFPAVGVQWFQGDSFWLLYLTNHDVREVTSVYIDTAPPLPNSWQMFDVTDFVRQRRWETLEPSRHLEMFPGQGQIILIVERERASDVLAELCARTIREDQRQVSLDLSLAKRYDLPVDPVIQTMRQLGLHAPIKEIDMTKKARDYLTNVLYGAPIIRETRSQLLRAAAAICACDGALCRLLAQGRADEAHEYGLKVVRNARELTHYRLQLRRGKAAEVFERAQKLADDVLVLLNKIRGVSTIS